MRLINKLKILLGLCYKLTFWLLYFLSGLIPRNEKIKLYGGMGYFSNNSKYAFLFALQNNSTNKHYLYWVTASEQDFVFLTRNNLPVLKKHSLKGIWYCLRAKYYYFSWFVDDINFWTSRGAILTSFWHGLPIKKIQYDIQTGDLGRVFNPQTLKDRLYQILIFFYRPAFFQTPSFLYCPDKRFSKIFQSAFKIKEDQLVFKEYPRVEYLLTKVDINFFDELLIDIPSNKIKIIYIPTFRDFDKDWFNKIFTSNTLHKLNQILKEKNMILYVKAHPNEKIQLLSQYDSIVNLPSEIDLYTILKKVKFDIYLTDYSSVFFEIIKLSNNVELFWPDYHSYLQYSRDWYFDLREYTNKKPIYNIESLLSMIMNISCTSPG